MPYVWRPGTRSSDIPMRTLGKCFAAMVLLVMCAGVCPADENSVGLGSAAKPRKNVLVLLPDNLGFEGQERIAEVLRDELDVPDEVELYTESLDLMRLKSPVTEEKFAEIYRAKYQDIKIDLIIAGQRPALEFLLHHRNDLFTGVPIVFGGIPKDIPANSPRYPGVTGTLTNLEFQKTVELAMTLQPTIKNVVVVVGVSPRDRWLEWIAKGQLRPYEDRLHFEYWEGLTPEEARQRLRGLTQETVVYYLHEYGDHLERHYSPQQYLERIAPDSPVPVYSSESSFFGHGMLGGYLYDPDDDARKMAFQAKAILAGKNPDDLTILDVNMYSAVDWREMRRWGIPQSRVPAGTELKFRAPSVWEKYKANILGVLLFIGLETLTMFLLLAQIKRKNRAQRMLERRFAIERVAAKAAEQLAICPAGEVFSEIQKGLEEVLEAERADRAVWFSVTQDGEVGERPYFALRNAAMEEPAQCECAKLPWIMKQVVQGRRISISRLEDLPREAAADRKHLEETHVQSMVVVPSRSDAEAKGVLVLLNYTPGREWPETLASRLGMLASLFGTAMSRKRAEEQLKEKQEWLALTLGASMTALWELDVRTGRVRWSQSENSLLGKEPVELEASYEKFLEMIPEEDREDLYNRTLAVLHESEVKREIVTEWRYHEPGGSERWLLFRGQVFRDDQGRPLRLRGVNVDITDLKQAKMELLQLTERLIRAQEEERQRLARELHDDIGQRLSLLIIGLDRLKQQLPLELRMQREQVAGVLEEANVLATDIVGLSYQLHSSKLQHLGLKSAMRDLCSQFSRQHAIEVKLIAGEFPGNVSEERALCLYRVAQESLKNAIKHSGSPRVEIEFRVRNSVLQMKVKDYGCGFDPNHCEAGLGLASMRERLRMVGGAIQLQTTPGQGTEIVAEVGLESVARHASVG
jgi:PAS domain S-box-containing protein